MPFVKGVDCGVLQIAHVFGIMAESLLTKCSRVGASGDASDWDSMTSFDAGMETIAMEGL